MKYVKLVEDVNKLRLYVLVGPPAVGKSTWIKRNIQDPYVISRDEIVEEVAKENGFTYDELFLTPTENVGEVHTKYGTVIKTPYAYNKIGYDKINNANNKVTKLLQQRFENAVSSSKNIVVDMTNMNINSRGNSIRSALGDNINNYYKVAVQFNFKGNEELIKKISSKRAEQVKSNGGSKTISYSVLDKMFSSFVPVDMDKEPFDKVIEVNNNFKDILDTL
jgi:predicted kinase